MAHASSSVVRRVAGTLLVGSTIKDWLIDAWEFKSVKVLTMVLSDTMVNVDTGVATTLQLFGASRRQMVS